jgi:NCAIR mutase (PurE)-related protein
VLAPTAPRARAEDRPRLGLVDRPDLLALLQRVAVGDVDPRGAFDRLAGLTDAGLAHSRPDTTRALRTGDPEVVYGAGKTPAQTAEIVAALRAATPGRAVLVTRAGEEHAAALPDAVHDPVGRTLVAGPLPAPIGSIVVVAAGTSDAPVAAEAATTARVFGAGVTRIDDVGVAGLHRLLAVVDTLAAADALVVVAGMEGALPTVVAGLVGVPVVGVPTSVGYGVAAGGLPALAGMLSSCAAGLVTVNIDNGFGAAVHAARIARARHAA